jgi:large subunit ribosomal protein L29
MKVADIRKIKTEELTTQANTLREEIAELKRRTSLGEVSNVRTLRAKRKDLARVLTVLGEQIAKENI